MSEDRTPQRPDGLNQDASSHIPPTPRVEVEPTPVPPVSAGATSQIPDGPGFGPSAAHVSGSASADTAGAASGATVQQSRQPYAAAPGATAQQPYVAPTASAPQETVTRTVVKTKTKKLPVFLASLAGLAVGAVLVIALVMTGAFRITDKNVEPVGGSSASGQSIKIDPEDTTLAETVSAKALPSVVSITAQSDEGGGVGSGVILDKDGNILTNYHVVEGATELAVSTDAGESYEAEIVGTDESSDLAVIRIKDAKDVELTPIEVGDSDDLTVGEWVMAIGSPFGNEQSVSTGIVSALYRSTALPSTSGTSIYANMIQTDAAINPGNSGGALVNNEGKLVGINSIIESASGSSSGVGFAIPGNYAVEVAKKIIGGETVTHAYLGGSFQTVTAQNARRNNLSVNQGAYVAEVTSGSPADQAGIKQGDIITAIDDQEITSSDGVVLAVRSHNVGDTVQVKLMRGSQEMTVSVTLGSDEALQSQQDDQSSSQGSLLEQYLNQYGYGNGGSGSNGSSGTGRGGSLGGSSYDEGGATSSNGAAA